MQRHNDSVPCRYLEATTLQCQTGGTQALSQKGKLTRNEHVNYVGNMKVQKRTKTLEGLLISLQRTWNQVFISASRSSNLQFLLLSYGCTHIDKFFYQPKQTCQKEQI